MSQQVPEDLTKPETIDVSTPAGQQRYADAKRLQLEKQMFKKDIPGVPKQQ